MIFILVLFWIFNNRKLVNIIPWTKRLSSKMRHMLLIRSNNWYKLVVTFTTCNTRNILSRHSHLAFLNFVGQSVNKKYQLIVLMITNNIKSQNSKKTNCKKILIVRLLQFPIYFTYVFLIILKWRDE